MKLSIAIILLFSLIFLGCNNTVEDTTQTGIPATKNPRNHYVGHFIDSAVEGLEYSRSKNITGLTKSGGEYSFSYGELINFHVGNVTLGESVALSQITPKEIVAYEQEKLHVSIYTPEVFNRVRFLMSIDTDKNADNGIQIDDQTRLKAQSWKTPDFSLDADQFTTALEQATNNELSSSEIVDKQKATQHFADSLRCVYSGAYRGQWILPNGNKSGFVGVMIQADGGIIAMGDGQEINDNTNAVIYSVGHHDIDTETYTFDGNTYYYNPDKQAIDFANTADINGTGKSRGSNSVYGSFIQDNQTGTYSAFRVGNGSNVAYRYTGVGKNSNGGTVGLFTLDINVDGSVTGMIHDSRVDKQFDLRGTIDFTTNRDNVAIQVVSDENYTLSGDINFTNWSAPLHLVWKNSYGQTQGSVDGIGCKLQEHQ